MRTAGHRTTVGRSLTAGLVLCLAVVVLAGCSGVSGESLGIATAPDYDRGYNDSVEYAEEEMFAGDMAVEEPMAQSTGTGADVSTFAEEDRLIIRNKALRMEVEDVRSTVDEIRDVAAGADAIITNVNVSTDGGYIYRYDEYGSSLGSGAALAGWVTVRVPSENFEEFTEAVSELGEILWEGESQDDVTQQHVDLSARLDTLKAEEVRLREFLNAATDVEEMLMVERELGRVRQEIESMTAQIAYLERQASMATVTIELSEPTPIVQPDGPDWGFARAFTAGLQLAANVVKALIVVLLGALPLIAIAAVLFLVIRAIVRARRKKGLAE